MTASALYDRLRPGHDSNDTTWRLLRSREDWAAGRTSGLGYDPATGSLALAPVARPELTATWLASAPVTGPDGRLYRADPERDLVLTRGACDADWSPLPGLGGAGFATGRLDTPVSLAVDRAGRLWIADAGNGRVQVFDPAAGEVVAALTEGLARPAHVAFAADGTAAVCDALTRGIHLFSARFEPIRRLALTTLDAWSGEAWATPPEPEPRAATFLADGALAVFDPTRPGLWRMDRCGRPLTSLPWFGDEALPEGWSPTPARYVGVGEAVVGPIDGGVHDFAWHQARIEADLPPGCHVSVQTFAANAEAPEALLWAPARPLPIPRAAADRAGPVFDRLALPETDLWPLWRLGRMIRARPEAHRFAGDGPVNADSATVPFGVVRRLTAGDRVRLTTRGGGVETVRIVGVGAQHATVAAEGPDADFAAPDTVRLLRRNGRDLPYGPLDLSFLCAAAAAALPGLSRDRNPEQAELPGALAGFIADGDVLGFGPAGRLEILAAPNAAAEIRFDRAVAGDFSNASLSLDETAGRLLVTETLPQTGPLAPGVTACVIDDARSERHAVVWTDAETGAVWLAGALAQAITPASWTDVQFDAPEATDRGRFLWMRLALEGAPLADPGRIGAAALATATPRIRSLRLTGPRPSLLRLLPALFSRRDPDEDAPGANFLERFLSLFEGQFTRIEDAYESVSRLLNPRAADAEWLAFVGAWLDLAFDPSWPIERRRRLVIEGAALQAGRGTPRAMARWLEIYTGASAAIAEGFRSRPPAPITLGGRGALGVAPLAGGDPSAPDRFAHRFTVAVTLPGVVDRAAAVAAVRKIVEAMKPAHTAYALDLGGGPSARIGIDTAVDAIMIPPAGRSRACLCDSEKAGGPRPETGQVPGGFRMGGRLGRGPVAEAATNGG